MPIKCPKSEAELDELLSDPSPETIELMKRLDGDIIILGVGGKMGSTVARMAVRAVAAAGVDKRVIGVARFSEPGLRDALEQDGVETIACDLSDIRQVETLTWCKNVIFMAGRKFGLVGSEAQTWIMNVIVPSLVAQAFRESRIVAFSTGCVYELRSAEAGGSSENDAPAPVGEYANSCLGRERVFEYYSGLYGTPVLQYRLNYSIDLRYGVLADVALPIWKGEKLKKGVRAVNVIWQGDAVNRALLSLEHATSPPTVLNVTGPEQLMVADLAERFGKLMNKPVIYEGEGRDLGYLSNAERSIELFGAPRVSVDEMVACTADWIMQGGRNLDKPTHFTVSDGQFLDEKKGAGAAD